MNRDSSGWLGWVFWLLSTPAWAQLPGASTQTNPPEFREPVQNLQVVPVVPVAGEAPGIPASGKRWRIREFHVAGNTLLGNDHLLSVLAPFTGLDLPEQKLAEAGSAVVAAYLRHGWLARVELAGKPDGVMEVRVTELRAGQLHIDRVTDGRAGNALVDSHVGRLLVAGQPLPVAALERGTALLNALPGVAAATTLAPGKAADEADVRVRLRDRPLFSGRLFADNFGLRETGEARLGGSITLDNGIGLGDQGSLVLTKSEASAFGMGRFSLPLGGDGWRAGLRVSHFDYADGRNGGAIDLKGTIDTWRANLSRPLLIAPGRTLIASLAHEQARLRDTAIFGEVDERRIHRWALAVNYKTVDALAASTLGLEWSSGKTDLSGNAGDRLMDSLSTRMHGNFARLTMRLGHERRLGGGDVLVAEWRGQLANRNLEPSLKMYLGGPDGVRAYPQAEAIGDAGWLARLERRKALSTGIQGSLFFDVGHVVLNRHAWSAGRNDCTLAGAGVGVLWQLPDNYLARFDLARQIGNNPLRDAESRDSDERDRRWRFWLSLSKSF